MLGKLWKKILLFVLIIACLFDITAKLINHNSLKDELEATIKYFKNENKTYDAYSNESTTDNSATAKNTLNAVDAADINGVQTTTTTVDLNEKKDSIQDKMEDNIESIKNSETEILEMVPSGEDNNGKE
jgi:hypothetical protein